MWHRRLLLVAVLVALAAPLTAQVTFGAQTSNSGLLTAGTPTLTVAHTTGAGENRILLVSVHLNVTPSTGTTISGVTCGGTPLTLLDAITDAGPTTRTELWYMLAPPVGAANVIVTGTGMGAGSIETVVGATTFSGVDQSAPPTNTAVGNSANPSVALTGTVTTDVVLDFLSMRETGTLTPTAPQVAGYAISTGGTTNDLEGRVSGRAGAAGTTTMSWTNTNSRRWSQIVTALKVATADVEVDQRALNDPVVPGGILTYTFLIQNNGPSTATGVTLTDPLPGTVTYISAVTTLGSCSGTSTVTCNIGTMTNGQTATVTIQVQAPLAGGTIATNTGTVTTTTTDPATPNTASATAYSLVQASICETQPGKDGSPGTVTGTVNSYWPATASAAAGATTITVGTRRGAAVSITAGDLVLVIQMQDAAIDSNNDDRYGNGKGITGNTTGIGSGYTNANNVGRYEYVIATNTVNAAGGAFNFTGVNGSGGLVFGYTNAAATATMGQRRFQIVRVPQYATATMGALTASAWNGTSGGILALDVAGDLALGGATATVSGLGFRGGAGLQRAGGAANDFDYRNTVGNNAHGVKAEGIAGTPEWVLDSGANLDTGPQGYPNGDFARGAPGNAGGGGTDTDPALNQENSGGGGGANWGRGGGGGNAWQSNGATGGFGGAPFYDSPGRVVLGGGGGAGARNNSSGIAAAGAAGGGVVLIRAGRITGTGTITANGSAAFNTTANDGGGGGGAGGSIVILARGGGIGGLTLQANGGRGGDAWSTQPPGAVYPGERHGPGGGGGGGYIALNGSAASTQVNGGASGITTTANDVFGAQTGQPGNVITTASFDEITGVKSACVDLSVSISDSPDPVIAGNNITYTQSVTNNSTVVPAQNVVLTQTTPPGTTFVSMTPPAGWTCGTLPAVGGTGSIICTKTDPLAPSASSGNFTLVVATSPSLANGSTITQSVSTSTSNTESDLSNNSASTNTTVVRRVDIAVTKVTNDDGADDAFQQGETLIYTIDVTNNGPSRATNVVMTDPLPAGFSFSSVVPGGPTCTQASGTVTCTYATMDPGAVNSITITGTITVSQTQLSNTATTTRTETDTDSSNDAATALANVLAPTVVHMLEMSAVADVKGKVQVTWTTSFETDNLGFNLYRDTSEGRVKVNKQIIAGSAFFAAKQQLDSGRSYRWKDKIEGGAFAQYYLEDIDLDGTRTLHGPVTPALIGEVPETANTDTLADLGSVGGIFVSPRGLGAPRYPVIEPTTKQREQQYDLSSQSSVKLMVTQEGWYRVAKSDLAAAGFDAGHKVALFAEGIEQPIVVTDDAIEFYGIGRDTPASGARAYWLSNEKGLGNRVKQDKSKGAKPVLTSTPFTFERIERTVFFTSLTNNGDRENFFGAIVTSWEASQSITVENLDRTGNAASMELVLQGGSAGDHAVRLSINSQNLGTVTFSDKQRKVATVSVPLAALNDGANTLALTALNGDYDVSVVEALRFTYPHRLVADNDALKVTAAGGTSVTVSGFASARVRAIDVTDAAEPVEVAVSLSNGNASFAAPGSGTRSLLVIGDSRILPPAQIVPSRASTWNDRGNEADMVIIAARALAPAIEPLRTRRANQGVSSVVVDVQDLYDEFGFGQRGPRAIREFLSRTRDWKRAPKYVLLLGDASIDPRNYLGLGTFDYVPTKLVPTFYMKTASDDWFVDFGDTGEPQLAIGRLPARTLAEAETMVRRIVERDTNGNDRVSFVTDSDPEFDFSAAANTLADLTPSSSPKTFAGSATTANFESLVFTYIGHGSVDFWNAGSFTGSGARQLGNAPKLPIVAAMTCLNGYFHDVYMSSLAEALLTSPNGGAVAVWTSSTLTEPVPQLEMAAEMFRQLFGGATIGEAAMRAKSATSDQDVRKSWILFGDPSMPLR